MGSRKAILQEYVEVFLIAVILATFARTYVLQAFKIPTASMEQNLLVGDHILVNKFVFSPALGRFESRLLPRREVARGDVVVFRSPEDPTRDFVKRCVGLAGDRIAIIDDKLHVNGLEVEESAYVQFRRPRFDPGSPQAPGKVGWRENFGPITIPEGHLFVLGDNRDASNDSRFWGALPSSQVHGRAWLVYWSFDRGSDLESDHPTEGVEYWAKLRPASDLARRFFTRTRWRRTLHVVR